MYQWIFICGILFSFYNAWGIGTNDCANSFATSVGSGVLTLRKALIIASIFEFGGAVLMGSHVTNMVRKKIVSLDIFDDNPGALMFGMLCADLSSAIWLNVASYFKLPVSTTHSIIGAIVGFSLAYGGKNAVNWDKIGLVVASWIISPLLAGVFSLFIFFMMNTFVFKSKHVMNRIILVFPIITFITFFINSIFIVYKGSPQLELDEVPFWKSFLISSAISIFMASIARFGYVPYFKRKYLTDNQNTDGTQKEEVETIDSSDNLELTGRTESYHNATEGEPVTSTDEEHVASCEGEQVESVDEGEPVTSGEGENNNEEDIVEEDTVENELIKEIKYDNEKNMDENIMSLKKVVKKLEDNKIEKAIVSFHKNAHNIDPKAEKLCNWIQIITACFSSFAHGSNDVANAIAPLATIYHIYEYNSIEKKADVPIWILLLGGFGIVFGLATWGYKIINRMGREITKISASRGFIIELSAALTVIIASRAELPVSTTHCQVGSIVGTGLVGGLKNVKWSLLNNILLSWLVTLPITGFLSAALFSYGYYSPYDIHSNSTY
jgi:solute carrier family 20 (sodium-dependent phosphate transporter)